MSKFFQFDQNNTGGSFITDDKVCHRLFIEADSVEEAIEKAENLGCYWDGVSDGIDCPCCGDRWHHPFQWGDDGNSYPMEYDRAGEIVFNSVEEHAQYLANDFGWTSPDSRIFYADGTVREVFTERGN